MNIEEITKYINTTKEQQFRAGKTHGFIDISIMELNGRFFVRRSNMSVQNSWYTAFLKDPYGEIKLGDTIIPINAVVPDDLEQINPLLSKAYEEKFGEVYLAIKKMFPRQDETTMELVLSL